MSTPVPPYPPPPGPPGPPRPPGPSGPPRKKSRTGLIVTLVVVLGIVVCGGCGGGVWYFGFDGDDTVGAMIEDEPAYPQQYEPSVPAAPSGEAYGYMDVSGTGELCDHVDRTRVGLVLPVTGSEHGSNETDDEAVYECTLSLSNLEDFPHKGAEGEFQVVVRAYTDPSLAEGDYAAGLQEFAEDAELPADGMEVEATAFQNWGSIWSLQAFLLATDGNMSITVAYGLETGDDGAPPVPVEVLVGICVDTANEIIPLAAKDE